jgi:quercetin dioxygenase-like cupin family protein
VDFQTLEIRTGLLGDLRETAFPTQVYGWREERLALPNGDTHYGVVVSGPTQLSGSGLTVRLESGMFFVVPGECDIVAGSGLVISRIRYRGLFQIGGPVETDGRLRYIDGCSDTLLVCPPRLGEPCLNHLHIPPHTDQTAHTHPSERVGVILRGRGECRTSNRAYRLEPGMAWRIPTGCLHSFHTGNESLDVIAWHPDSDFGPTDENHPMINRTIIR